MAKAFAIARSLDHLVLTCRDVAATSTWYSKYLGMEVQKFVSPSTPTIERVALRFGLQKINLHQFGKEFEPKARVAQPGSADLCFLVGADTNLEVLLESLQDNGISLLEGGKIVSRTGAQGPIKSLYMRDPDGNLIELSKYA